MSYDEQRLARLSLHSIREMREDPDYDKYTDEELAEVQGELEALLEEESDQG